MASCQCQISTCHYSSTSKMSNVISLILINLVVAASANDISGSGNIDPSKVDYCKLPCLLSDGHKNIQYNNTSCGCDLNFWREASQEVDDIVGFRQTVLDTHNELRNQVASGYESDPDLPPAADMMAFSYDLELEHGARCYVKGHVNYHDHCRRTTRFEQVGQNIASGSNERDVVRDRIRAWYVEEISNILPETIDNFTTPKGVILNDIAHFTQFVWGEDRYVGCATGFRPNNQDQAWRWIIICNYGGPFGGNAVYHKVYTKGKPCSKCPKGTGCNKRWPNLCGDIEPIPGAPHEVKKPTPAPALVAQNLRPSNVVFGIIIATVGRILLEMYSKDYINSY